MKTFIVLALMAVLAVPAIAGESNSGSCPSCDSCPLGGASADRGCDVDGFTCQNMCPLAKQANGCRSLGDESATISVIVRKDLADTVASNLARI